MWEYKSAKESFLTHFMWQLVLFVHKVGYIESYLCLLHLKRLKSETSIFFSSWVLFRFSPSSSSILNCFGSSNRRWLSYSRKCYFVQAKFLNTSVCLILLNKEKFYNFPSSLISFSYHPKDLQNHWLSGYQRLIRLQRWEPLKKILTSVFSCFHKVRTQFWYIAGSFCYI